MSDKNTDNELEVSQKQAIDESSGEATWEGPMYRPEVDIYSTEDRIVLLTDMPGVEREQLDVDLRERVLTLVGRVADVPGDYAPVNTEYGVGGYVRRFTLADDIDQDGIEATLKDGVLQLVLPRAKEALPRKIEVRTA